MKLELIPLRDGRPAVVMHDGWKVYVSVKDAEYMRLLKVWKGRLRDVHPDKGGSAAKFRRLMGEKIKWQCEEAKGYAELGLLPPDGFRHAAGRVERRKRLTETSQHERQLARKARVDNGDEESAQGRIGRRQRAATGHRHAQSA